MQMTPTIEWAGKIARLKQPIDGAELRLLATLMHDAGGHWDTQIGGWIFQEDAYIEFHRVPEGCKYDVCPSPFVQHVGAL